MHDHMELSDESAHRLPAVRIQEHKREASVFAHQVSERPSDLHHPCTCHHRLSDGRPKHYELVSGESCPLPVKPLPDCSLHNGQGNENASMKACPPHQPSPAAHHLPSHNAAMAHRLLKYYQTSYHLQVHDNACQCAFHATRPEGIGGQTAF